MLIKGLLLVAIFLSTGISDEYNQNIITLIGTTNVYGEIDPCG